MNMWPTTGPEGIATTEDRLRHIVSAIQCIEGSMSGDIAETLANDLHRCMAIERLLEIIAVASEQLPADLKAETSVDWNSIAEIGERLEHACDRMPPDTLRSFSEHKLPSLKQFATQKLTGASGSKWT